MRSILIRLSYTVVVIGMLGCGHSAQEREPRPTQAESLFEKGKPPDYVKLSSEAVQRAGVQMGTVTKEVLTPTFRAPARVTFNEEAFAHVGTPVTGRVLEIKVRLSDMVAKNEPLLIVESPELGNAQSDYLQKRSAVAVAESALKPAQSASERGKELFEKGQAISGAEAQKREAQFKAAQGDVESAQSAVRAANEKLQTLGMSSADIRALERNGQPNTRQEIRAPIAGTVIQREVTLGELVIPDKENLLVLADMTKLWIIADVPENKVSHIKKGGRAWVWAGAATDATLEGTVSVVSPSLDLTTRSVQVRLDVNAKDIPLLPGMFAEAEIEDSRASSATPIVAVPESAVQTIDGQSIVFVPVEAQENTFEKRVIQTGPEIAGMLPVMRGLKAGETIVIAGSFVLKAELGKVQTKDED